MAESNGTKQPTNDKSILLDRLRIDQANYPEGSKNWIHLQHKIDQIIADRFLDYVNR